jgi:ribose-phosphate pyrophosphokinase
MPVRSRAFFDIPTDNLFAAPVMVQDMRQHFDANNLIVVSPDVGGVVRAPRPRQAHRRAARHRRQAPRASRRFRVMNVIGRRHGAHLPARRRHRRLGRHAGECRRGVARPARDPSAPAYISHGVLSGGAVARITNSRIKELVITDSILPSESVKRHTISAFYQSRRCLGEAIARTAEEQSVSSLFY